MKRAFVALLAFAFLFTGCGAQQSSQTEPEETTQAVTEETVQTEATQAAAQPHQVIPDEGVQILLSDDGITVDGEPVSTEDTAAVHTANSIVYYEEGHDFTYGEGTEADEHSAEEAQAHTVVTITQPGTYILTGSLSAGQVAVDLGDEAEEDPEAVVTLVLDGVDITCTVAPAVIFYNVYECGNTEEGTAIVDTAAAGANVLLADGSVNNINGSYVARIYKEGSVVLSEDGTEVEDAKKLHKYDGAFYSKMSMNVGGNDGILNIQAENEGLDSELHLTINGGEINIVSGNDGINTNEDGISVTTVNDGRLTITVSGSTGEGDGIDSNGYLVINGGTVIAAACSFSGDAGIDSDMGIYINGGTVLATGNMLDRIAGGDQTYAVFTFAQNQVAGGTYELKNGDGQTVLTHTPVNDFSILILAGDALTAGDYTFWQNGLQLSAMAGQSGGMMPGGMGKMPEGEMPEDMTVPEGMENMTPPAGEIPNMGGGEQPSMPEGEMPSMPEGEIPSMPEGEIPSMPEGEQPSMPEGENPGGRPDRGDRQQGGQMGETSEIFTINQGGNYFSNVTPV